jgi:hypothetical protein
MTFSPSKYAKFIIFVKWIRLSALATTGRLRVAHPVRLCPCRRKIRLTLASAQIGADLLSL